MLGSVEPSSQMSQVVDVIVPVYGQIDLALRCISSVVDSQVATPFELVVIDDCSPDEATMNGLAQMAVSHEFDVLRHDKNLGFPATCNTGFRRHPERDVVILNSDTVVFGDWLDRLRTIAYSDQKIGTVTPLTNDGIIASYPKWLEANEPGPMTECEEIDRVAGEVNADMWAVAPTGVGFCMYIKRSCLDEVGEFDAWNFGTGYGEENDFCQRAINSGWVNAITPSVYVRHDGGSSFGPSKESRMNSALAVMERQHPGYLDQVKEFIRQDPLAAARERIDIAMIRQRTCGKAVLMVTHNWGGGTERHVQELRTLLETAGTPVLIARPDDANEVSFTIVDPLGADTPNLKPLDVTQRPNLMVEHLEAVGVTHVHVHNLVGYSEATPDYLVAALAGSGITYDVTIHDYNYWCPRINLVGITGVYCGEPDLASCDTCVATLGVRSGGGVSVWRRRASYESLLRNARRVFAPSEDVASRLQRHFPGLLPNVRPHEHVVVAHTDENETRYRDFYGAPRRRGRPSPAQRRIGVIGELAPHKGSALLQAVAEVASQESLPLHFSILGSTDRDEALESLGNTLVLGRYREQRLEKTLEWLDLDAVWFPAVAPETYSYTLSAALQTRHEVVAFDLGAIAHRLRQAGQGTLIPMHLMWDPKGIAEILTSVGVCRPTSRVVISPLQTRDPLREYYGFHDV